MKKINLLSILTTIALASQALLIPKPLPVNAKPARCLLQFDGVTYINGDCEFINGKSEFKTGGENGSFHISTGPLVACDKDHTKQQNMHQNYHYTCAESVVRLIKKGYFADVGIDSSGKAGFTWGGESGFSRRYEPRAWFYLYKNGACWGNPKAQEGHGMDWPVKPAVYKSIKVCVWSK